MKKLIFFILPLKLLLSSCATETYFNIGVSIPSGFSRYADKCFARTKAEKQYDVIIVPGVPYEPTSVSSIMKIRILWAIYLYDNGFAKNIIFSGSAVYSPFIEGVAMKIIADSLGIPADHTFFESKAEHSTENIYYSWKMAKEMGFQKIALATDPFQSIMLKGFIKKYCPEVESVPVVFDKLKLKRTVLPAIDATNASVSDFVSLADRETFTQRIAGMRGKRVVEEVKREKLENFLTRSGPSLTKK